MCQEHAPGEHSVARVSPRELIESDLEQIRLEPVDAVFLTTLVDNVSDMLLLDQGPAKRGGGVAWEDIPQVDLSLYEGGRTMASLHAEHGFSMLVTVVRGDRTSRLLFDTGVSPDGMVANMALLGLDPGDVEAVILSHGHFDHTAGLDGFVRAVGAPNVPVLVHPGLFTQRRIAIPGLEPRELPTVSRRGLADAGFEVIEQRQPSLLFDRSVLVTGEVDRTTPWEQGLPFHEAHGDHGWEPDPLILDDQALVVDVRGLGLVVLTGCGHAGIVNIVRHVQRLTGVDQVHAVVGGFHLSGPMFAGAIAPTVEALSAIAPDVLVPAHCTGWSAMQALATGLPDAFIQNSVGTRFELEATPA